MVVAPSPLMGREFSRNTLPKPLSPSGADRPPMLSAPWISIAYPCHPKTRNIMYGVLSSNDELGKRASMGVAGNGCRAQQKQNRFLVRCLTRHVLRTGFSRNTLPKPQSPLGEDRPPMLWAPRTSIACPCHPETRSVMYGVFGNNDELGKREGVWVLQATSVVLNKKSEILVWCLTRHLLRTHKRLHY